MTMQHHFGGLDLAYELAATSSATACNEDDDNGQELQETHPNQCVPAKAKDGNLSGPSCNQQDIP